MQIIALLDEDGRTVLYDLFIGGYWHGSRRTLDQCFDYYLSTV